ncbi:MAG: hypothetical protein L3K23_04615 [Thermoplasmata archaeon]|nr:hypothetical protein [Thermoplasmata archaeon]
MVRSLSGANEPPGIGPPRARRRRAKLPATGWGTLLLVALLAGGWALPSATGTILVQFHGQASSVSLAPWTSLTGLTTHAGLLGCASTAVGTVPVPAGSGRGSVAVTEPAGCGSRTRLAFLPALHFGNGLPIPAGHVLDARLDLIKTSGSLGLTGNLQLYLQAVGGGNPIVTGTHLLVRNGVVVTTSTSVATLVAGTTYGPGIRMILVHPAVLSTLTLTAVLYVYLDDGGVVRAVQQLAISFTFTY